MTIGLAVVGALVGACVLIAAFVVVRRKHHAGDRKYKKWSDQDGGGTAGYVDSMSLASVGGTAAGVAGGPGTATLPRVNAETVLPAVTNAGVVAAAGSSAVLGTMAGKESGRVEIVSDDGYAAQHVVVQGSIGAPASAVPVNVGRPSTNPGLDSTPAVYSQPFTVEQYIAAGWTMDQINLVKPPIAPTPTLGTTEAVMLERAETQRSVVHEPLQSS
ncbi:hypothetical protein HDU67_005886 [Dinochytrium kinnereticum]|nr:hypothetical protein HDU67_005886 [Dinochytrium kinnereticum]